MRTNHSMHIMDHIGVKNFLKQHSYFHACFDDSYPQNCSILKEKFRENANQARISSRCVYHNCAVCSVWGWGNFFKQHHYFKIMILFVLKSIRISKFGIKCLICQLNFLLIKDLPRQKAMFSKIESFLSLKTILSIIINLCWVCLFILQFGTGCSFWD